MTRRNKIQSPYMKWGLTAAIALMLAISFFFLIYRYEGLLQGVAAFAHILTPFVYGLVMAYLVCPLYNVCVAGFQKIHWPRIRGKD